jgi:RNase H
VADIGDIVLSTVQSNLSERCPGLQTNNRAELIALIRALEEAPPGGERSRLIIKTDSKYSISCVQLWARNWESRGWVKLDGQEVLNAVRLNSSLLPIAYVILLMYMSIESHSVSFNAAPASCCTGRNGSTSARLWPYGSRRKRSGRCIGSSWDDLHGSPRARLESSQAEGGRCDSEGAQLTIGKEAPGNRGSHGV